MRRRSRQVYVLEGRKLRSTIACGICVRDAILICVAPALKLAKTKGPQMAKGPSVRDHRRKRTNAQWLGELAGPSTSPGAKL